MKILITGDRDWGDKETIKVVLSRYSKAATLIHGGARGADTLAHEAALELGWLQGQIIVVPAEWERFGRGAGQKRNIQMLDMRPQLVIAFHDDLENSKGTKHCTENAIKRGIPVVLAHSRAWWKRQKKEESNDDKENR